MIVTKGIFAKIFYVERPNYMQLWAFGQGGLVCCDSWGHKESDTTERLIWSDLIIYICTQYQSPKIYTAKINNMDRISRQVKWSLTSTSRIHNGKGCSFQQMVMRKLNCALLCSVAQSCLTLATPCTVAHWAPLTMGFFRQEYWSELPFPPTEDFLNPGIEPVFPVSPALKADSLPTKPVGKPEK